MSHGKVGFVPVEARSLPLHWTVDSDFSTELHLSQRTQMCARSINYFIKYERKELDFVEKQMCEWLSLIKSQISVDRSNASVSAEM